MYIPLASIHNEIRLHSCSAIDVSVAQLYLFIQANTKYAGNFSSFCCKSKQNFVDFIKKIIAEISIDLFSFSNNAMKKMYAAVFIASAFLPSLLHSLSCAVDAMAKNVGYRCIWKQYVKKSIQLKLVLFALRVWKDCRSIIIIMAITIKKQLPMKSEQHNGSIVIAKYTRIVRAQFAMASALREMKRFKNCVN